MRRVSTQFKMYCNHVSLQKGLKILGHFCLPLQFLSLAIRAAKIQFTEYRLKRFSKRYWLYAADSSNRNLANFLCGGRHPLVCSLPAGSRINVTAHNRGNSNYKENFTLSWKGSSNTRQSLGHFMLAQHDE